MGVPGRGRCPSVSKADCEFVERYPDSITRGDVDSELVVAAPQVLGDA